MTASPASAAPNAASVTGADGRRAAVLAVWALVWRELVRFFRQRTRVIGAVGQPVIFWILFGAGLRGSFKAPDWAPDSMTFQEYFLPGIAALVVLFTAIFSTISVIEDRREGFLQGVLAAPIPRLSIVLGKVFGGTILALIQASLFLCAGPLLTFAGLAPSMNSDVSFEVVARTFGFVTLLAFGLTALGYCIAWPLESTQGFHAIMSVVLMPMWLLSGAFFPGGEGWLGRLIRLNPLTYGVAGLRRSLYPPGTFGDELEPLWLCVAVSTAFATACLAVAVVLTNRRRVS